MFEHMWGFSGAPSLFGRLIDGVIIAALVICGIQCCRRMCRPRWTED